MVKEPTVFHGTVGQSSAQVIDGSLRFVPDQSHLKELQPLR